MVRNAYLPPGSCTKPGCPCIQNPVSDQMWRSIWGDNRIPDLFTQTMQDVVQDNFNSDLAGIFACRLLLDIQSILGENVTNCFTQLNNAIDSAQVAVDLKTKLPDTAKDEDSCLDKEFVEKTMLAFELLGQGRAIIFTKLTAKLHKDLSADIAKHEEVATALFDEWQIWNPSERCEKLIWEIAHVWFQESMPPHDFIMKYGLLLKDAQLTPISLPQEAFLRGRRNPLSCGIALLEINLQVETYGLRFRNKGMSIFLMAHLYNALRQFGKLGMEFSWPEMDKVIESHLKAIFSGELPDNEDQCQNRLMLRAGFRPEVYLPQFQESYQRKLKDGRMQKNSDFLRPRSHEQRSLRRSNISTILASLYDSKEPISMERCLFQLDQEVSLGIFSSSSNLFSTSISPTEFKYQEPAQ